MVAQMSMTFSFGFYCILQTVSEQSSLEKIYQYKNTVSNYGNVYFAELERSLICESLTVMMEKDGIKVSWINNMKSCVLVR